MKTAKLLLTLSIPAFATAASFCSDPEWNQVYADEFNGETLDDKSWTIDLEGGDSRVRESQGTADNVYLENGNLVLRSQKQQLGAYNYTSGSIQSQGLKSFKGKTRVCVMAKLPGANGGNGIWPAHWLMVSES